MNRFAIAALLGAAGLAFPACSSREKVFTVTSYPEGATVYVNDSLVGPTNRDVRVSFKSKGFATVRLEKKGFQNVGTIVNEESQPTIFFTLQEAPNAGKIIEELNEVNRNLEGISSELKKGRP